MKYIWARLFRVTPKSKFVVDVYTFVLLYRLIGLLLMPSGNKKKSLKKLQRPVAPS